MYKRISDAAAVTGNRKYGGDGTKIWYYKDQFSRDSCMGVDWLKEQGGYRVNIESFDDTLPPVTGGFRTGATVANTHTLLGEVGETDLDNVFHMMQGFVWSPEGESYRLIRNLGLCHTSMSVGDIIQTPEAFYIVDNVGFRRLPEE